MSRNKVPDPTHVDRAITALSAFAVTTEREAKLLLPMWVHYGEMTAGQVERVYDHYRTGSAS